MCNLSSTVSAHFWFPRVLIGLMKQADQWIIEKWSNLQCVEIWSQNKIHLNSLLLLYFVRNQLFEELLFSIKQHWKLCDSMLNFNKNIVNWYTKIYFLLISTQI